MDRRITGRALGGVLFACVLLAGARTLPGATFYVAVHGSDAWSGTLADPNAARTDGPFATLQRARDAVRGLKAAGPLAEPVTVYLRGGVYRLERAIDFLPEDSGSPKAPTTYAAYRSERPVLSGGRPITGWQPAEGSLWKTAVPGVKEGRWFLIVAGEKPHVFDSIPYVDPQFSQLTWFGFASTGSPGSVFYVDNLTLALVGK
jgi:hypothetical protein